MRHTMHHNMHDIMHHIMHYIMHYTVIHDVGTLGNSAAKTIRVWQILADKGNYIQWK